MHIRGFRLCRGQICPINHSDRCPLFFDDDSHRALCLRAVLKDGKDTESLSVRIRNLRVTAE